MTRRETQEGRELAVLLSGHRIGSVRQLPTSGKLQFESYDPDALLGTLAATSGSCRISLRTSPGAARRKGSTTW